MDNHKNNIEIELNGFSGYELKHSKEIDEEITRIGPGTKAGEYLRRFWHPIFISSELDEVTAPKPNPSKAEQKSGFNNIFIILFIMSGIGFLSYLFKRKK